MLKLLSYLFHLHDVFIFSSIQKQSFISEPYFYIQLLKVLVCTV